jgi:hypothetical protein
MDILTLKAIYGVVSGIILYILTIVLRTRINEFYVDYILIMIYLILYVGYLPLMKLLGISHKKHLTKGISIYYAISFITWVVMYDLTSSLP